MLEVGNDFLRKGKGQNSSIQLAVFKARSIQLQQQSEHIGGFQHFVRHITPPHTSQKLHFDQKCVGKTGFPTMSTAFDMKIHQWCPYTGLV